MFEQWRISQKVYYIKYLPTPLAQTPLINLDDSFKGVNSKNNQFLCPTPWYLVWRTKQICFDCLIDSVEGDSKSSVLTELGQSIQEYLYKFLTHTCGEDKVIAIDKIISDKKYKHADFIVLANDVGIIIECKRSIGNSTTKTLFQADNIINQWEKIVSAIEQCISTINSDITSKCSSLKNIKKFVSIVCFDDHLLSEAGLFQFFAFHTKFFKDSELRDCEIMSLDRLEKFLINIGPVPLAKGIINHWDKIMSSTKMPDVSFSIDSDIDTSDKRFSDDKFLDSYALEICPGFKRNE